MKLNVDKKYLTIAIYVCVCAAIILALYFIGDNIPAIKNAFDKFNDIMSPVYYGLIFAYIANPLMVFFEKKVLKFKKKERKLLKRTLSLIITYLIILSIIAAFFMLLLPQVISSYNDLYSKTETLIKNTIPKLDTFLKSLNIDYSEYPNLKEILESETITDTIKSFFDFFQNSLKSIYNWFQTNFKSIFGTMSQIIGGFFDIIIGLIFSVYFLASKEKLCAQLKKCVRALLSDEHYTSFFVFLKDTDKKFGSFIIGKIVDSLIIGVIAFIVLAIIGMPYYPLVSVIVCVTNVIPFIGPFIGAIPCAFIILTDSPVYCLIFIIFIFLLQQLDGNYIGPKILGDAIGISSLWILFAITVMGGYFGLFGMLIGAPLFAVIYSLVKTFVEKRLKSRELPYETKNYIPPVISDTKK